MHNSVIIKELLQTLRDMDYFNIYPSSDMRSFLSRGISDTDKIRRILSDTDVQEYLFPNYRELRGTVFDPVDLYIEQRRDGTIPTR